MDVQLMLYLSLLGCYSGFVYLCSTADLTLAHIRDSPVGAATRVARASVESSHVVSTGGHHVQSRSTSRLAPQLQLWGGGSGKECPQVSSQRTDERLAEWAVAWQLRTFGLVLGSVSLAMNVVFLCVKLLELRSVRSLAHFVGFWRILWSVYSPPTPTRVWRRFATGIAPPCSPCASQLFERGT